MEKKILKLKITNVPDARNALPSERRYSASLVLGFSVMFLVLFILSSTVGGLIIHKIIVHGNMVTEQTAAASNDLTMQQQHDRELELRILKDLHPYNIHYEINMPSLLCAGCFIMALGHLVSSIAGFLAWKRWFIDKYITFFCLLSGFSIFTSAFCLLLNIVMLFFMTSYDSKHPYPPIGRPLSCFVFILSIVSIAWSVVAAKIAFRGMKNHYPDGALSPNVSAVNTICRQSMDENVVPSQLFNQCLYTSDGKVVRYLREDGKDALSGDEYERVKQFVREHYDKQEARC